MSDEEREEIAKGVHALRNSGVADPLSALSWESEPEPIRRWYRRLVDDVLASVSERTRPQPSRPDPTVPERSKSKR